MLAEASLPSRDLRSLRALVFAGAMFPAPLREKVASGLCSQIYEYYGMQETGALTVSTPSDRTSYPESIGAPLAFAEIRIQRPDGSRAAPGEIGEIVGRSPATVTRYFDNPEKSAETFRGGWVHTGDLGMMNEDGFVFIKGRLKDMIITGGQNVHAAEVEETLIAIPGVADCAVFGLPDELWGERVAASIVRAPGAGGTLTVRGRPGGLPREPRRLQDAEDCLSSGRAAAANADRQGPEVPAGRTLRERKRLNKLSTVVRPGQRRRDAGEPPVRSPSQTDGDVTNEAIPGVADCAVFGLPDELWGERVAASIVRAPGAGETLTVEGVLAACRESLAGFKTPKILYFQDEPLPRTPTGKVQKFLLVERYGAEAIK